ncbi:MAG TPA: restriction endonuclease [Cyclobacteriaceae bacterium]|nr:restriction endonuclease [Cyclobacteriaceae bacterium]
MTTKKYSFREVAIKILERFSEPKTAKEITYLAIEEGLLETTGATPEATMAAQIYLDINNNKGTSFRKVGRGLFTLKTKTEDPSSPHVIIYNQNELTKKDLMERLLIMDPFQFEFLVADLLQKIGYENVFVTKRSGDKGIDITANLTVGGVTNVKTVVQVKRYSHGNKIDGKIIAQLRGSAEVDQRGLVITTSEFQKSAVEESNAPNKMPVSLVNGDKLIELLIKYGIGIKKDQLTILSVDNQYFENESDPSGKKIDSEKSRSIWPLPGGIDKYVDTLDKLLEVIKQGTTDKEGLINWVIKNYENVKSEKTTWGYINVPKNMGLISFKDGKCNLTEEGEQYLGTKDLNFLYETISKNILAFDDIYQYLKTVKEPQNEEQILDYLKDNFDIEWSTFAQVNFRLLWLENLKKIKNTDQGYTV